MFYRFLNRVRPTQELSFFRNQSYFKIVIVPVEEVGEEGEEAGEEAEDGPHRQPDRGEVLVLLTVLNKVSNQWFNQFIYKQQSMD